MNKSNKIFLCIGNSAYIENINFETLTCALNILKLHAFGGLHTTTKCWKFEPDILWSNSWVMVVQKYIKHNKML